MSLWHCHSYKIKYGLHKINVTLFPISITLQPFFTPNVDNGCSISFSDFPMRKKHTCTLHNFKSSDKKNKNQEEFYIHSERWSLIKVSYLLHTHLYTVKNMFSLKDSRTTHLKAHEMCLYNVIIIYIPLFNREVHKAVYTEIQMFKYKGSKHNNG